MIKRLAITLIFLFSLPAFAIDVSSDCGLIESGEHVEPFSTTICPQDKTIESLFNLFPDLTIRGIELFNLEYGNEMIEKYSEYTVLSKERALQSTSYYITQISMMLIACVITLGTFNFIYEFSKGKNNKKGESINVPNTIFLSIIGLALLVKMNGFYGYQWLVLCAGFLSIGLTNALISTLAYYLQSTITNGGDPELGGGASLLPYSYDVTNKEISTTLCTLQLLVNEEGRDKGWFASPLLDQLAPSEDQDSKNTPIEVFASEGSQLVLSYGTGTASSGILGSLVDWFYDRNPQLCGKETIDLSGYISDDDDGLEKFDSISSEVNNLTEDDLVDLPSIFALWATDGESEELTFSSEDEREYLAEMNKVFHKVALFSIRNPLASKARESNYYRELYLAQQIRMLTCIENISSMYKNTSLTLDGVGGIKKEFGCATKIMFNSSSSSASYYGSSTSSVEPYVMSDPEMFFEEKSEDEIAALREETLSTIESLKTEATQANQNMYGMLLNSYIISQSMQKNSTIDDEVLHMRQDGLASFSVNFMALAQVASKYKKAYGDLPELVPNFIVESLNEYFLPQTLGPDEIFVSKVSNLALGDDYVSEGQKIGSRSLMNDVYKLANAKGNSENITRIKQRASENKQSYFESIEDSFNAILINLGLGVDDELFENSGFLTYALSEGWSDNQLKTNFLIACYAGKTANFSDKMIIQCESLSRHPLNSLRDMGEGMILAGLSIITLALAGSMAMDFALDFDDSDHGAYEKNSSSNGTAKTYAKKTSKSTAKAFEEVADIFDGTSDKLAVLGGMVFLVGVVLACFVPLIPVISFGVMYFYWLLLIAIGVIAGSIFIPMYFKSRVQGGEVDEMDSALTRLLLQIVLKPLIMIAALIMVWMLLDLSLKLGTLALTAFWTDTKFGSDGTFLVIILMTCMMLASSYIYMKLTMFCYNQLHDITSKVMDLISLGGHSTYRTVTDYAGMFMLRTIGNSNNLKKTSTLTTWLPRKSGQLVRTDLASRRAAGKVDDSEVSDPTPSNTTPNSGNEGGAETTNPTQPKATGGSGGNSTPEP